MMRRRLQEPGDLARAFSRPFREPLSKALPSDKILPKAGAISKTSSLRMSW